MPAYVLLDISIDDMERFKEYAREVGPVLARYGARYLVRAGNVDVLEGEWDHDKVVLIEFPSREAATEFYRSEEYEPLLKLRLDTSSGMLALLDGYEPKEAS